MIQSTPSKASRTTIFGFIALSLLVTAGRAQTSEEQAETYTCATGPSHDAHHLNAQSLFSNHSAGWDIRTVPSTFEDGACIGEKPFFLSIPATDGLYEVTLDLGGPASSVVTVKAEARRLMILNESIAAGGTRRVKFTVAVRTPKVSATQNVKLKPREVSALDWDEKLTLEFNGSHPAVRSVSVRPVRVPVVYLAGDSTVVDQDSEPWAAWGQMIPLFFGPEVAVANNAESGETIRSFTNERRFAKIFTTLRRGDFLLIQFAHNDQKPGSGFIPISEYKERLTSLIKVARAAGATPVLVTSMNRRHFDDKGHIIETLGDYPKAMRELAADEHVHLIDLNAMSKTIFERMGETESEHAFVHFPANTFPSQPQALKDNTHFSSFGGYELALAMATDIQRQRLTMARYLRTSLPVFSIEHPDRFADFHLPASPTASSEKPYER